VNSPTPAIVTQKAARPLPRWALLLLCLAYVVPGFVGRGPWKNADVTAFGYMMELANGHTAWLRPQLGGMPPETDGLLPYWLGAWAIQITPDWLMAPEMAARLPFMALLVLTLAATWYGVYYLARSPGAQPVAFAFGGEANPSDYARAIADGALLALIACLGLAQLSHEATGYLAQLACAALIFFAVAALPHHTVVPAAALIVGIVGLTLAGAPTIAALLGVGSIAVVVLAPAAPSDRRQHWALALAVVTVLAAVLAWQLDLWRWRLLNATTEGKEFRSLLRLLVWFGWPAWPMATWTLWRWRKQLFTRKPQRHLWLPLWFSLVSVGATFTTQPADRALLVGLPAVATLAAFALPTFRRSMAALIDWFTLLFFSVSALAIWVIWFAMQTGVPAQPAANVARLAPGFTPTFSWLALVVALGASAAWCRLVWWRAARNRAAIWKSLVLPASGAALCWLLLTTLWLPLLDYARSYAPQARKLSASLGPNPGCVQMLGLSRAQMAALQYHTQLRLQPVSPTTKCPWLVVDNGAWPAPLGLVKPAQWTREATIGRPTDKNEFILLFRRTETPD
jgi:4-amino-4-deoxy-L-arabinose transferase-like glycosyltransferase